jgi:hypothetical protein
VLPSSDCSIANSGPRNARHVSRGAVHWGRVRPGVASMQGGRMGPLFLSGSFFGHWRSTQLPGSGPILQSLPQSADAAKYLVAVLGEFDPSRQPTRQAFIDVGHSLAQISRHVPLEELQVPFIPRPQHAPRAWSLEPKCLSEVPVKWSTEADFADLGSRSRISTPAADEAAGPPHLATARVRRGWLQAHDFGETPATRTGNQEQTVVNGVLGFSTVAEPGLRVSCTSACRAEQDRPYAEFVGVPTAARSACVDSRSIA